MKLGIIGNREKPELTEAVALFLRCLDKHNVDYVIDEEIGKLLSLEGKKSARMKSAPREECVSAGDILVAFGGDGTILSAARSVGSAAIPVLGINLGKLGFLAEVAPAEIQEAVHDLIQNRYVVEERLILRGTAPDLRSGAFHAVNDIVVSKGRSSRLIDLETHINGAYAVTYRGDGLIVSTPTGSTAYALSSGGPIVIPTSSVLCLTPISPHTLSGRPLVVPDDSIIRLVANAPDGEILVSADGQEEAYSSKPLEIVIAKAEYKLRLVKRFSRSYFDVLRAKLLWGKDPRSH